MFTSAEVHDILVNWKEHEWQLQGFGMLRTYLPGEGEPRLQIWDQRLAQPGNNTVHDHPWNFESRIYAGLLYNQRYQRLPDLWSYGTQGWTEHFITPGVGGGEKAETKLITLKPEALEVYAKDETYGQHWSELHLTRYLNGTVSLITRDRVRENDTASSMSRGEWTFFEPRPATRTEIKSTVANSLKEWWA